MPYHSLIQSIQFNGIVLPYIKYIQSGAAITTVTSRTFSAPPITPYPFAVITYFLSLLPAPGNH